MKKNILLLLVFWGVTTSAMAINIPWETISGSRSSGQFGWNYAYDIGFFNNTLMIDLDINLVGDPVDQALQNRWELGIEQIWSTSQFEIPISFNVDWVSQNYDQTVNVHAGSTASTGGTFNMTNWYTVGASGWGDAYQEEVVAHEAGHMFGLWDEYVGGAVDPISGTINTGGLMHTLNGPTLDYYYDDMLNWYHANLTTVPVPASIWLFCSGLIGLFGMKKRELKISITSV
ncbi:MAG: hypothetical protein L3J75_10575 [Methylococcaceae bacterium]|nr:hypothetical protein [Methylococcaceae bacterium]